MIPNTKQDLGKHSVEQMLESIANQTQSIQKMLIIKVDSEISQSYLVHSNEVNDTRTSIINLARNIT